MNLLKQSGLLAAFRCHIRIINVVSLRKEQMTNKYQIQAKISYYDEVEVEAANQKEAIGKAVKKLMDENGLVDAADVTITEIREDFI